MFFFSRMEYKFLKSRSIFLPLFLFQSDWQVLMGAWHSKLCAPWSLMEKSQEMSAMGDFHSVRSCVILFSLVELSLQLVPIPFLIDIRGIYQIVPIDDIN